MTDLENIKQRMDKDGVIFLTSFFNLFLIRIVAILSPAFIAWMIYKEWKGFNGLVIFLSVMLLISIVISLYFLLTTGSVLLRGQTLTIKQFFSPTRKVNLDQIESISEKFIRRALTSSGTRITRINYVRKNGKRSYILILEGKSMFSVPQPSVHEILSLAGWKY